MGLEKLILKLNTKKIFILLFLISTTNYSQVDPDVAFYPLHVGDYWIYEIVFDSDFNSEDTTYYDTTSVDGLDTLYGKTYFIVNGIFGNSKIRIDSSNATVWSYAWDGEEYLVDSLSCSKGDLFGFFKECIQDTILNIFQEERGIKTFRDNTMISIGSMIREYTYASGIGKTNISRIEIDVVGALREATLVYAKINGIEYGTKPNDVEQIDEQKLDFNLEQNYPNPFNPSTTIKYTIPHSTEYYSVQHVTLKVYDILGREVTTLVNKEQKAGNYEVQFDASANSATARTLTSGIYFYKLQLYPTGRAGSFVATKKLLLLK